MKQEEVLTTMKQDVVVENSQSVPHDLRNWTLFIFWTVFEVGQQKHLEDENSETTQTG